MTQVPGERAAIIDACVLVQAPLRDTLLRLAEPPSLYHPLWTEQIIVEMKRALEEKIGLAPAKTAYLEAICQQAPFDQATIGG